MANSGGVVVVGSGGLVLGGRECGGGPVSVPSAAGKEPGGDGQDVFTS